MAAGPAKSLKLKSFAPRSGLPQKQPVHTALWEARPRGDTGRRDCHKPEAQKLRPGVGPPTKAARAHRPVGGAPSRRCWPEDCQKSEAQKLRPEVGPPTKAARAHRPVGGTPSRRCRPKECQKPEAQKLRPEVGPPTKAARAHRPVGRTPSRRCRPKDCQKPEREGWVGARGAEAQRTFHQFVGPNYRISRCSPANSRSSAP